MLTTKPPRFEWLAVAAMVFVAFAVRVIGLDARPMHSDEANQAVKLGRLLEGEGYRFDPVDHHGPTLYYFAAGIARLNGMHDLASLTERTVRLTPVIFGSFAIGLVWWLARSFGVMAAATASLVAACSPTTVYYSRYFIQETLLGTFLLLALACGRYWFRHGGNLWLIATGAAAGLMVATKLTALMYIALALLGIVIAGRGRPETPRVSSRDLLLGGIAAVGVAVLFYSSFGTNLSGVSDAARSMATMLTRATDGESGHEKPWWYYLQFFVFHRSGGYVWDQTLFLVTALAGLVAAWRGSRTGRVLGTLAVGAVLILSLTPYKTPWQIVSPTLLLCVLAGAGLARMRLAAAVPLGAGVVILLAWQSWQAAFFRPADPRNPYAYVHSSPDMKRAEILARAAPPGPIKVIAEEYWPLPWYLRHRAAVGYWTSVPDDCDAVLVFADSAHADAVRANLRGNYRSDLIGLRPGVILEVFERQ